MDADRVELGFHFLFVSVAPARAAAVVATSPANCVTTDAEHHPDQLALCYQCLCSHSHSATQVAVDSAG